jgi:hypothetical protein
VAGLLPPMRRGIAPTVLLLDASTFEDGQGPERGANHCSRMVSLLSEQGVPSYPITKGMPFKPVVEHKRTGPPEFKVLPGFGRVIAVER